jgi:threonine dehydratase
VTAPTLDAIRNAQSTIKGIALRTPLVPLGGVSDVHLKLENLQPTGAFKIRGAANAMSGLGPEQLAAGVVTASAGNMAQAVAWQAQSLGVPCTVIAPDSAPEAKLARVRALGSTVITVDFDRWWQTFIDRRYPGLPGVFIHAFDDERVMAGNGTIGVEIVEDLPEVEAVLVPWGGGGLATGIAIAVKALRPSTRLYAVEVEGAAPLAASLAAGRPEVVDYRSSFVDGIGSKTVMPPMFELASAHLDGALTVTVAEVAAAVRLLAERNRVVAEGAGAAPVAAALSGRLGARPVACVVSGGNIDLHKLAVILEAGVP